MKALVVRKIGMTSLISDDGSAIAVTLLSAEPNVVTQIKTEETDGYTAIQIGTGIAKKQAKPQQGHFKKANTSPKIVREFRPAFDEEDKTPQVGDELAVTTFETGDIVDVTGTSKGKGFAGTIKRHNFHRGRKTHGGRSYRRPGSIGSMYPQRIFPGKKMAGHMGHDRTTIKRLKVVLVDEEHKVIGLAGAVPGPRRGAVTVRRAK